MAHFEAKLPPGSQQCMVVELSPLEKLQARASYFPPYRGYLLSQKRRG